MKMMVRRERVKMEKKILKRSGKMRTERCIRRSGVRSQLLVHSVTLLEARLENPPHSTILL